jgi:hypothetical protein
MFVWFCICLDGLMDFWIFGLMDWKENGGLGVSPRKARNTRKQGGNGERPGAADSSSLSILMDEVYSTPYSIRRYMGKNSWKNIFGTQVA